MNAQDRISNTIGTLHVQVEVLKDQVQHLTDQVAERDAKIQELMNVENNSK